MRSRIWVALFFLALASMSAFANESSQKPVTGMEWLQESIIERLEKVRVSMVILHANGVPVSRSSNDYYNAIEQKIRQEPDKADSDLTSILASIIYKEEPESREALDKFRTKQIDPAKIPA